MSDELSIQAVNQPQVKQTSPVPYALGGAVVGGLTGAAVANYTTKPKYASFEDIIADTKDNFEKNAKDVISEEANQTKAINARQAAIDAGAKWEDELNAFKEANKEGATPELAADHELMKQKAAIQDEIKTIESAKATTKTVTKEPLAALRQNVKDLNKAADELRTLKAEGATKEAMEGVNNRIKALQTRQEGIYNSILEGAGFKGTEAEIKAAQKDLKTKLEGYTQEYMANYDKYASIKPNRNYIDAKTKIADNNQVIDKALADIKEATGYKVKTSPAKDSAKFAKEVQTLKNIEIRKNDTLKKVLDNYSKIADTTTGGGTFLERLENALKVLSGGTVEPKSKDKEIQEFIKNLTDAEKKVLNGKNVTKENLEQLIKDSEGRLNKLNEAAGKAIKAQADNVAYTKITNNELNNAKRKYGKGAYFNEKGEICVKGKPVEKAPAAPALPKLDSEASKVLPKEVSYETKASGVDTKALNDAKAKLAEVETKITDARNALPKAEAKTEEQILKEFVEKNGEKADAMKKAFGEDVKALLEKKIPNKKLAGYIAGGAAILGALGYAIAPKNKEV